MKSSDPYRARVAAEINIYDAVAAIEHFAENLPNNRQTQYVSDRLFKAAAKIQGKAVDELIRLKQEAGQVEVGYAGREPIVGEAVLCRECLTHSNACGPFVHQKNCSLMYSEEAMK